MKIVASTSLEIGRTALRGISVERFALVRGGIAVARLAASVKAPIPAALLDICFSTRASRPQYGGVGRAIRSRAACENRDDSPLPSVRIVCRAAARFRRGGARCKKSAEPDVCRETSCVASAPEARPRALREAAGHSDSFALARGSGASGTRRGRSRASAFVVDASQRGLRVKRKTKSDGKIWKIKNSQFPKRFNVPGPRG